MIQNVRVPSEYIGKDLSRLSVEVVRAGDRADGSKRVPLYWAMILTL